MNGDLWSLVWTLKGSELPTCKGLQERAASKPRIPNQLFPGIANLLAAHHQFHGGATGGSSTSEEFDPETNVRVPSRSLKPVAYGAPRRVFLPRIVIGLWAGQL